MGMERINSILQQDTYQDYLAKNNLAEEERKFCRHNIGHFLDVARIAVILNNSDNFNVDLELIYGAALLHDIGRWKQYEDGTPHEEASALLAPEILIKSGFNEKETAVIVQAIENHRNAGVKENKDLNGLLYRADKLSRACFACDMEKECNWKKTKKNLKLLV